MQAETDYAREYITGLALLRLLPLAVAWAAGWLR